MIIINGRFLSQSLTGVQRYAFEMSKCLSYPRDLSRKRFLSSIQIILSKRDIAAYEAPFNVQKIGFLKGHFWEQFFLGFRPNCFILNFCNTFPIFARKQLVVFHDASVYAVPGGYRAAFVIFYKFLLFVLRIRRSIVLVTDSEFSRQQIARYAGINSSRIHVVPCGADHWQSVELDATVIERLELLGKPYLLAVASLNPNKNLPRLIRAYALLSRSDVPLVLVGGMNSSIFSDQSMDQVPGVVLAGRVSDSELAALYSNAHAMVFPSLYEGFGLPALEAMTFGCPVVSSREASLPEVCGDAALYCDAYDEFDIARAMRQLLEDSDLCQRLREDGFEQIKKFRWQDSADKVLSLVEKRI